MNSSQFQFLQQGVWHTSMIRSVALQLAKIHYTHDAYTVNHSHRVGLISRTIAKQMQWSNWRSELMYSLGLMHDVGKMHVPLALLNKQEKLYPEELASVKKHVEYGHELLKPYLFDDRALDIIVQHHERIDGSGYPRGLQADQIYDEAKVLMVADVFEAIVNKRSYRVALGVDVALSEIQAGSGKSYDAQVCDALLHLIEHKQYQCPTEDFQER